MKKMCLPICSFAGVVMIVLGLQIATGDVRLPGLQIVVNDSADVLFAGAYGPCTSNGKCQGSRPPSVVCVSQGSGQQGLCTTEASGQKCGSCTGTIDNEVCAGTDSEKSCTTSVVSDCCNVNSSCISMAADLTHPNGYCSCLQDHGGGIIGTHVECVSF
jgi:hypothetical protein